MEFINIAAHELRTPIMPIIGGLELLEVRLSQIPQGKKVHQEIKRDIDLINRNALKLKNWPMTFFKSAESKVECIK
ncbi:MAG: hypothetical protein M3156_00580 [Thermoproteota archaeon]|nr:hypothetical protein [Thermoproteota archaeon]